MLDKEILDKRNNIEHSVEKKKRKGRGEHYEFSGLGGTNSFLTSFTFSPTSPNFDTLDYFPSAFSAFPDLWAIFLRGICLYW